MYKKDHHYYYYAMSDIIYPQLNFAVSNLAVSEVKSRQISYPINLFNKKINLFQYSFKRQNTIIASWKRPFFLPKHITKKKETKKMYESQHTTLENLRKVTDPKESLISKVGRAFFDKKPNQNNGSTTQNNGSTIQNNHQIANIPTAPPTNRKDWFGKFFNYSRSDNNVYETVAGYGNVLRSSHTEINITLGCNIL